MSKIYLDEIIKAPEAHVRAILRAVCDDRDVLRNPIKHYQALQTFNSAKRKATSDVHICVQCGSPFSDEDNVFGNCFYHTGRLEPDMGGDFWADHDEDCHGIIDSDFCREEYPEGFRWECCEKQGPEVGCTKGKHEADPKRSKGKSGASGDYPLPEDDDDDEDQGEDDESEDEEY